MRIGFDCAPLVFPHSPGIRRVVENTLQALEERGNMQVVRLMPDPQVELRHWRQKDLARWVQQEKLQGLHAFQSAFCRRARVPVVQTVHELSWRHGVHEAGAWKQKLWVWLGRRRAAAVVCATDFAARDYRAASRRGPRPTVIPWGLAHGFDAAPGLEDPARLQNWGLAGKRFVLSPGGLRKKKRPLELLNALLQIQPACTAHLVFTGPDGGIQSALQSMAKDHGIADRILFLPDLSDGDLAVLYRHAHATAVLSASEGFALPVLESLASDTAPLVTPDSAQSEVAGPHGIPVSADRFDEWHRVLGNVLSRELPSNPAGVQHAKSFTWDRTAQRVEELWRPLI